MSNIKSYFPFSTPREKQLVVMDEIEQAYRSGYRYILAQLPTGFGKSPLAVAVARFFGTSYFCTGTKDLQEQYRRDFPFMKVVKGRSNFECLEERKNGNYDLYGDRNVADCDHGPCVVDARFNCVYRPEQDKYLVKDANMPGETVGYTGVTIAGDLCKYFDQKYSALAASHAVFNYKMFLKSASPDKGFTMRNCLVADEAHMLESELTEYRSLTLSRHGLMKFLDLDKNDVALPRDCGYDVAKWINYIKSLRDIIDEFIDDELVEDDIVAGKKKKRYARGLYDARKLLDRIDEFLADTSEDHTNWIVSSVESDRDDGISSVTLKPMSVRRAARQFFGMGSFRLMMSATILSKDNFCNIMGLDPQEVKWIEVSSDFPVENRPIYALNLGQLNARNQQLMLPRFVQKIDEIMTIFGRYKGIIHVTSYAQLQAIKSGLCEQNRRRLLETGEDVSREELVMEHAAAQKPTVLISPSLHTGLDLKGDLARFQIIVKVPYPDLSDRLVDARRMRSPWWYNYQTAMRIVQAYGRAVRSKDDWACTFVLDSNFRGFFWRTSAHMLPVWFREAVRDASSLQHVKAAVAGRIGIEEQRLETTAG